MAKPLASNFTVFPAQETHDERETHRSKPDLERPQTGSERRKLNRKQGVTARYRHDTASITIEPTPTHLLSVRSGWISPDNVHVQWRWIAAAVPGRCQSAAHDDRISLEQVAAQWRNS